MKSIFLSLLLLCLTNSVNAQPFTLKENIKPINLEFHKFQPKDQSNAKGMLNISEITQTSDTLYFVAKPVSIYSPIYVGVEVEDPSKPVEVAVCKMNWTNADRKGKTDKKGHFETQFKTETDFGIRIMSKDTSSTYKLIVWVGDEANFELPATFSQNDVAADKKGMVAILKDNILYIVIAFMALVILLLLRRKKSS